MRASKLLLAVCSSSALVAFAGCQEGAGGAGGAASNSVARVNGVEIPRATYERELKSTLDRYEKAKHAVPAALKERLKNGIVERMVDAEIIRQQADKLKVGLSDQDFETRWTEYRTRYGDETAYKAFLLRAGTTEPELKDQLRQNLLREKVFATVSDQVTIPEDQLRAYFEQNKDRFDEQEQVHASHLLLKVASDASAADKAKRKTEIEGILKQAKQPGADFAALATKFSEDGTKMKGGDLGWFPRGRMVKPFEDVAFELADGQLSGVVETAFGFHLIKNTGHRPATHKTFDDVKQRIERQLVSTAKNDAVRNALTKWKSEAKIEILEKGDQAIIDADPAARAGMGQPPPGHGAPGGPPKLEIKQLTPPPTNDQPAKTE